MPTERTDVHMGEPGFLRRLFRPKKLESVFLFVTGRCNSRCRTCFYSGEVSRGEDMSFAQLRRISETAPGFDKLWLSGGEPFLRDDLVDIIELFYENNRIESINLPTNGLLGKRVCREVARLLDRCPKLNVHLNFSVDGMPETHDRVRGVAGGFHETMAAMEAVESELGSHPRLHSNVATVITPESYTEMFDLGAYLFDRFNLSTHFFEAMRGEVRDPKLGRLRRSELEALHYRLTPLYEAMAGRLFASLPPGLRSFAKLYFVGVIGHLFRLQEENLEGPSDWGMSCTAGKTTMVIDHQGSFRACEMRPRVGHLEDYDYDLGRALRSRAMEEEIEAIGGGDGAGCWCTHTCWMLSSMKFSPKTLLYDVPLAFARMRSRGGRPDLDVKEGFGYLAHLKQRYPALSSKERRKDPSPNGGATA